ncbi:MAG: CBS protein, partial [uncultured bacterium]
GLVKKAARNEFIHKVLDQPLSSLNPRPAVCVRPSVTLAEAIRLMNEIKAGCILVENSQGKLAGIVTERDIMTHLPDKWNKLDVLVVSELMTEHVEALRYDNSLNQALHQMSVKRFRHIVVYNAEGDPEVLSTRDLFKYLSPYLKISKATKKTSTKISSPKKQVKKVIKKTVKKKKK